MEEDINPEVLAQKLRQALRRMEAARAAFNREQQWDVFQVDSNGRKGRLVHSGFHKDIAESTAAKKFVLGYSNIGLFRHNSTYAERLWSLQ